MACEKCGQREPPFETADDGRVLCDACAYIEIAIEKAAKMYPPPNPPSPAELLRGVRAKLADMGVEPISSDGQTRRVR